jgi:hypothetical protein
MYFFTSFNQCFAANQSSIRCNLKKEEGSQPTSGVPFTQTSPGNKVSMSDEKSE